jgi:hypothetical protein
LLGRADQGLEPAEPVAEETGDETDGD